MSSGSGSGSGSEGEEEVVAPMGDPRLGESLTSMDWLPRVNVGKT